RPSSASGRHGSRRWSTTTWLGSYRRSPGGACSIWAAEPGSSRITSRRAGRARSSGATCRRPCWSGRRPEGPLPVWTSRGGWIERLVFEPARFDLVVSSLALHYVDDYAGLIERIASWLGPGGGVVYSIAAPHYLYRC